MKIVIVTILMSVLLMGCIDNSYNPTVDRPQHNNITTIEYTLIVNGEKIQVDKKYAKLYQQQEEEYAVLPLITIINSLGGNTSTDSNDVMINIELNDRRFLLDTKQNSLVEDMEVIDNNILPWNYLTTAWGGTHAAYKEIVDTEYYVDSTTISHFFYKNDIAMEIDYNTSTINIYNKALE